MTTTEQRVLKVTPNHSKRTFTLRFYYADGSVVKYRTFTMTKDEFLSNLYNTDNDWKQFLKTDDYYLAK